MKIGIIKAASILRPKLTGPLTLEEAVDYVAHQDGDVMDLVDYDHPTDSRAATEIRRAAIKILMAD